MAVYEAERAVVEDEAEDEGAFVAVQATHTTLYLCGTDILDSLAFFVSDEDTGEKTNHVRRVKQDVRLIKRHAVVNAPCQMLSPHPVLTTHVLLLASFFLFFLFTAFEQALWTFVSNDS